MTLTLSHGPLSARPPGAVNYALSGPAHKLFMQEFPRRVRARLGGETVLDTRRGMLLHETAILPQLYVPREDVRADLLRPGEHTTHCPFKGDASYWSVEVQGERGVRGARRVAENAIWGYPDPLPDASWLAGYLAPYWAAMDAWFDEDEEVRGHLRDPYHRVDVRASSAHVRVSVGGEVVAESTRPRVLSETGLPNRWYVPPESVRAELLTESATHTLCPYKGTASYRSLRVGERVIEDAAWLYPDPLDGVSALREHLSFLADGVVTEVDGEALPG